MTIQIGKDGQIILPIEINNELNLHDNDYLKVSIKEKHIELIPTRTELSEEIIQKLIHEGILLEVL